MSLPERTHWFFEQHSPLRLPRSDKPLSVQVETRNLQDNLSMGAEGQFQLGPVGLVVAGSRRFFLDLSSRAPERRFQLSGYLNSVSVEGSTFITTADGDFARLGLQVLSMFPNGRSWAGVMMDTGTLLSESLQWQLQLHGNLYIPVGGGGNSYLSLGISNLKEISRGPYDSWLFGALIRFSRRNFPVGIAGRFEDIQITLGPHAKWQLPWGEFTATLNFRVFLDKQLDAKLVVTSPSEFGQPDFSIRLRAYL